MTARQTTADTASDGYRTNPPAVPRPRSSSEEPHESSGDPREPGRRAEPRSAR